MTERLPAPPDRSSDLDIHVLDDDPLVRASLHELLRSIGLSCVEHDCVAALQEGLDADRAGCLILDLRLRDTSGIKVLKWFRAEYPDIPVIMISGVAEVPSAVKAMRMGAFDFVEKPHEGALLVERIQEALELRQRRMKELQDQSQFDTRKAGLTKREREVMQFLLEGLNPKQIALRLGLSHKTVQIHRTRVLRGMDVDSVVSLVRYAAKCGYRPE